VARRRLGGRGRGEVNGKGNGWENDGEYTSA